MQHLLEADASFGIPNRETLHQEAGGLVGGSGRTELAFFQAFATAIYDAKGPLGDASRKLVSARHAAVKGLPTPPKDTDSLTTSDVRRVVRSQRLAHNIEEVERITREEPLQGDTRFRLTLSALVHVAELVERGIWNAYTPRNASAQVKASMPLYGNAAIREVMELKSWAGVPLELQRLRNAWAHGDAWIDAGELIVQEDEEVEPLVFSAADIERYIEAGMALWWLHLLDIAHAEAARAVDPEGAARLALDPPR